MRNLYLILSLVIYSSLVSAQVFGIDNEGYSTILKPSAQLNLDLTNKVATVDFIKSSATTNSNKYIYWGGKLTGVVENDVSFLFSEEKIASSASIDGLIGLSESKKVTRNSHAISELDDKLNNLDDRLIKSIEDFNTNQIANNPADIEFIKELKKSLKLPLPLPFTSLKKIKEANESKIYDETRRILFELNLEGKRSDEINQLKKQLKELNKFEGNISRKLNSIIDDLKRQDEIVDEIANFISKDEYRFNLIYLRGGVNGSSFKYDLNNGNPLLDKRFVEKVFNGTQLEIGYNYNIENHYTGVSFQYAYLNNLSGLDEKSYSFGTADSTVTNGSLAASESFKAFSGDFDTFSRFSFNFDYVRLIQVTKNSSSYISLNPYIRHRIYSGSRTIKRHTVLGGGLYLFDTNKGKLLGGLFIQTNDLFGTNKTEDINTFGKTIIVGLVAKLKLDTTRLLN
jgi:hypothetical protein